MGRGRPPALAKAPGTCSADPTPTISLAQPRVGVGVQVEGLLPRLKGKSVAPEFPHVRLRGDQPPRAEAVCPRTLGISKK